jgi:hypothetical protein
MYLKEEAKQVRQQFWTMFGKRYHRKWTLYDTKVKDVILKFSFEDTRAIVSLDLTHDDDFFRTYYWEKLESLKTLMCTDVHKELIFDKEYALESGKTISRVYLYMDKVKIQKHTDWPLIHEFFYEHMDKLERFFWEYKDVIAK